MSVCQANIFLVFPFLEKWIWPSTNHWERVLFMLCQKLQHASLSLLVDLTLFVIMLCVVWRKPQCVLFVMGARGWRRCVFNYHLVEWLMVRQSSTELQLCACVFVCVQVCMLQTALCMFVCKWLHLCFYVICAVTFPIFCFHSTLLDQQRSHHYIHCYWTNEIVNLLFFCQKTRARRKINV